MKPFHRTLFTAIAALVLANSLLCAADPSAISQPVLVNQAIVQSVDTTNSALQVQDSAGSRQSIKVVSGMTIYRNGSVVRSCD